MCRKTYIIASASLLSVLLAPACSSVGPSTVSTTQSRTTVIAEKPGGEPAPADVWEVLVRITDASGGECVGDTMRSEIGVPKPYTLSIVPNSKDSASVTLKSASGDLFCTYPVVVDGIGFTPGSGYFTCDPFVWSYTCGNGAQRQLVSFGQSISGQISGNEITGRWGGDWIVRDSGDITDLEMTAEYSGHR